jgi:HD-GYP domain-containing protein (c-di-GMP phosphodiesterase class II)
VRIVSDQAGASGGLRLADLLAALSLTTDLGMGHPPEEAIRTCLLATELARRTGLPDAEVGEVYWTALLMHVGCTAFAHEQAAIFGGDEIAVNALGSQTDFGNPREAMRFLVELGRGRTPAQRARILVVGATRGNRFGRDVATATCEVAATIGQRLGMSAMVRRSLNELFERWDGRGEPQGLSGEAIAAPARYAQVAAEATVLARVGGVAEALDRVRGRAGAGLDPGLVEVFSRWGPEILRDIDGGDPWHAVLDAEPEPWHRIPAARIDDVARAFADAVDLKTPFMLGHSAGVAELAEAGGQGLGLPDQEIATLRRAGLFHDLGRVGVANGVWEKEARLTASEWEQVRLHAYHTERILSCSAVLEPVAPLAGMHHERLDGSGYHRQTTAAGLSMPARVLAAADAFQAMTQPRAHRPALSGAQAADRLHDEARAGRLDARAVDAVLAAAGQERDRPARQGWPAGLTDREVEVLCLLARGMSNRDIADRLFISPKTVGTHVEHVYQKLGVSSRAAAALFVAQHDLLT